MLFRVTYSPCVLVCHFLFCNASNCFDGAIRGGKTSGVDVVIVLPFCALNTADRIGVMASTSVHFSNPGLFKYCTLVWQSHLSRIGLASSRGRVVRLLQGLPTSAVDVDDSVRVY